MFTWIVLYKYNNKLFHENEFAKRLGEFEFSHQDCFCGEKRYNIISTKTRTGQNFTTVQCVKCGTLRINPYMTEEATDKYYKELYGNIKRGNIGALELFTKQSADAKAVYTFLSQYTKKNSTIVDFGGGAGGKTSLFVENDYKISIIESDERYRNFAIEKGFLKDSPETKYDLIIMLHVFEHIVEPTGFLNYLVNSKLNTNGIIYIEVPFLGGKEYKRKIINEIHIAHKWYFTKSSLDGLFASSGFKILARNDERGGVLIQKTTTNSSIEDFLKNGKKESDRAILISKLLKYTDVLIIMMAIKRIIKKLLCK